MPSQQFTGSVPLQLVDFPNPFIVDTVYLKLLAHKVITSSEVLLLTFIDYLDTQSQINGNTITNEKIGAWIGLGKRQTSKLIGNLKKLGLVRQRADPRVLSTVVDDVLFDQLLENFDAF